MSKSASPSRVRLADHVRACVVDDQMIFLDLRQSRYVGFAGAQVPALSEAILGPQTFGAQHCESVTALTEDLLSRLCEKQLLTDDSIGRSEPLWPALIEPAHHLSIDDEDRVSGSEWQCLARLWRSTFIASAWLRKCSLDDIVHRVAGLRARNAKQSQGLDSVALRDAAARYARLRPFALTTHDRCLNDSLTLIHFLGTQGLFPSWVIGVRAHPFGAHSWVQDGTLVLNDVPQRVRHYRPILVV